jgi:serine/threonine-protein kinase
VRAIAWRPGYVAVVQANGGLIAARFDLEALKVNGNFVAVGDNVEVYDGFQQRGSVSLSDAGDLLYITQGPFPEDSVLLVGRDGRVASRIGGLHGWVGGGALSPDGGTFVTSLTRAMGGPPNLWAVPIRGGEPRRVTFGNILDQSPEFLTDGREVAFSGPRGGGNWDLYRGPIAGDKDATKILDRRGDIVSFSFASDARWVVFCERDNFGKSDVWAHRFGNDSVTVAVAVTPNGECAPALSSDGRWLAYSSNESGRTEIFVRPFPISSDVRWQVTTAGGTAPHWSHSGTEIFFHTADDDLAALPVKTRSTFSFGAPKILFPIGDRTWSGEVTRDDQLLLMVKHNLRAPGQVILVRNWVREVQRLLEANGK